MNDLIHRIVGVIIEVGQSDTKKFRLGETIRYTPSEILRILTEHKDQIFGKEPSAEQHQDPGWQQDELNNNSTEVNKKNDELISREDALNFRVSRGLQEDGIIYVPMKEVKDYLRGLPSAQPEPKKGKWIKKGGKHICPNCGSGYGNAQLPHSFNYCPNCGCKTEA